MPNLEFILVDVATINLYYMNSACQGVIAVGGNFKYAISGKLDGIKKSV